jgi:NADPH-dependent 2,4-dienoyl-CoA reductase/sulfur reductase-like enzyme
MPRERLVVIGGDAAGMSAASQARKRRDDDDLEIVAFERGRATSYSACGIPYWIGGAVGSEDELISRSPEQHRANGIDLRMRTEVVGIDLASRG